MADGRAKATGPGGRITDQANIVELIEAGREGEAIPLLLREVRLVAAVGSRSARAALATATRLCAGDLLATIWFMNRPHPWLSGQTPIVRAERSEEDLEFVIDMIGAIEAGVYI